jgi:hypothetical protein
LFLLISFWRDFAAVMMVRLGLFAFWSIRLNSGMEGFAKIVGVQRLESRFALMTRKVMYDVGGRFVER